ncbi:GTP-binding protein [Alkalibacter mobilis]|uniref:GTP-binding protein n=1 Tax=Alkalibacter mobilis TaxID=2787712 RepID=UPI00189D668F|nr:GTP-binding protein [Alkalibacter mobilis]MBF7095671.1 cobalamin biosynthesis protein P47K [Alkalibacter mobilis]
MSKVFLVSGFLGSGKTTFIIKLMKYLSKKNLKVALIVNELGEIGIDNQFMTQLGYNVWELFGGCICCTLSSNLETTLQELEENYQPDIILVEPSGAAEPKSIYDSFLNLDIPVENIHNFLILDPTRIDMFVEILTPLLTSSLNISDTVLINKLDLAEESEIERCKSVISKADKDLTAFFLDFHNEDYPEKFRTFIDRLVLPGGE